MKSGVRKDILVRLRRIEGQVKGIQRMIEEEGECSEILNQILAVRAAVNRVGMLVAKNYAGECMLEAKDEESFHEALTKVIAVITKMVD